VKTTQNGAPDRIGELLLAAGVVTGEQLEDAVARQRAGDGRPLGEILVALGYACAEDIEHVLLRQRARRGEIDPAEGLRLLDHAGESTRRVNGCLDELAAAAAELGEKVR
jgi:hypothetical protein